MHVQNYVISSVELTIDFVPAMVEFCHGRKNMTRPSDVWGSSRPMFAGLQSHTIDCLYSLTLSYTKSTKIRSSIKPLSLACVAFTISFTLIVFLYINCFCYINILEENFESSLSIWKCSSVCVLKCIRILDITLFTYSYTRSMHSRTQRTHTHTHHAPAIKSVTTTRAVFKGGLRVQTPLEIITRKIFHCIKITCSIIYLVASGAWPEAFGMPGKAIWRPQNATNHWGGWGSLQRSPDP